MALMKALKTFRVGNTDLVVSPGVEFETTRGSEYERRGMAVPVVKRAIYAGGTPNKAAQSGPLASPGGVTGADKPQSSSHQGPALQASRSKKAADAPAS